MRSGAICVCRSIRRWIRTKTPICRATSSRRASSSAPFASLRGGRRVAGGRTEDALVQRSAVPARGLFFRSWGRCLRSHDQRREFRHEPAERDVHEDGDGRFLQGPALAAHAQDGSPPFCRQCRCGGRRFAGANRSRPGLPACPLNMNSSMRRRMTGSSTKARDAI